MITSENIHTIIHNWLIENNVVQILENGEVDPVGPAARLKLEIFFLRFLVDRDIALQKK
jgi:hypothetical protein